MRESACDRIHRHEKMEGEEAIEYIPIFLRKKKGIFEIIFLI
jgi:hypothetical protein